MSYCETCSTEYDDCKNFCKFCGSRLVQKSQDNEILTSLNIENPKVNVEKNDEHADVLSFTETAPDRIIDDLYDKTENPLIDQSTSQITASSEIIHPLVSSVVGNTDNILTGKGNDSQNDVECNSELCLPVKNHKEATTHSAIENTCEIESSQTVSSPDQFSASKTNSESSSDSNTSLRVPFLKSLTTALNEQVHQLSAFKPLLIVILLILFLGVGYWVSMKYFPIDALSSKTKEVSARQPIPQQLKTPNQVFDSIKRANLTKDIDLFMSCYSSKFKSLDSKKSVTLTNWEKFNYTSLNYKIRELAVNKNKAFGIVEWQFSAQSNDQEKTITMNVMTYNVGLEKEHDEVWKIVFLESI